MAHPLQIALAHHQRGQLDEARRMYEELLAQQPDHPDILHLLGLVLLQRGDALQAVARLQRAVDLAPQKASFHNNLGNALRATGQRAAAAVAWAEAARLDPTNAEAWCNLGVARLEGGDHAGAEAAWRTALQHNPDHIEALNLLSVRLSEQGKASEAEQGWRHALRLSPSHVRVKANLAALLQQRAQGYLEADRAQKAITLLREATTLAPDDLSGWMLLSGALQQRGKLREAFAAAQEALRLSPDRPEIHHNIGSLLKESGQNEEAIRAFRKALALGSTHPATRHALAALTGEAVADASPAEVVRDLFDGYAAHFDDHLTGELGYRTPGHLRELHGPSPIGRLLDLGCGTGLSGTAFHDMVAHMVGVDLSPKMLEAARAKGIYQELHEADVASFLARTTAPWDVILAADVFVYMGDLGPVLAGCAARLAPGGELLLSVEALDTDAATYQLRASERYAHSAAYLQEQLARAGLRLEVLQSTPLRRDGDAWIAGYLVRARRPAGAEA